MKRAIVLILLIFTASCSQTPMFKKVKYRVGVDPSFFPCELGQQRTNVFCFTREVFEKIAERNGVDIEVVELSWDDLFYEMALGRVDAVISAAPQTVMNTNKYCFSHPLLRTGPVLVVPINSTANGLNSLKDMVVSIPRGNQEVEIIANHPQTEFIFYNQYTSALELVVLGNTQGTLIPMIPAARFVQDLFHDSLKIVTLPLTTEGLRLLTPMNTKQMAIEDHKSEVDPMIKSRREEIIPMFNDSLTAMLDNGEYHTLLNKWTLSQ